MSYCFISTVGGYNWAGSENLWHETALRLLADKARVCAIVNQELLQSPQIELFKKQGGATIPFNKKRHPRIQQLVMQLSNPFKRALKWGPDKMLISLGSLIDPLYTIGLSDFLLKTNTPYIILLQFNAESLQIPTNHRKSLAKIFEKAETVVFVSRENQELAARQLCIDFGNCAIIHNPVRNQSPTPLPWPQSEDEVHFCNVARFECLWKAQDLLFAALADPIWSKRAWKLNLYGSGPDEPYLRDLVRFYKLEDKIVFHGYVSDSHEIWSSNHMHLLPSRGEGISLAMLEGMMAGRPCMAASVGGTRETIDHDVNGFICDASSPDSLRNSLEHIWEHRSQWKSMGQKAHTTATRLAAADPASKLSKLLTSSPKA